MRVSVLPGAFDTSVASMFHRRGHEVVDLETADVLVFTGGADIDPSLYGESNVRSYPNPSRDDYEVGVFDKYPEKPRIGICRGAQLLNVLSGGKLWQDINTHPGSHLVRDHETNEEFRVSSLHHQLMRPAPDGLVLSSCRLTNSVMAEGVELFRNQHDYEDVEAVYYERTRSFCFQPHPEIDKECEEYFFILLSRYPDYN